MKLHNPIDIIPLQPSFVLFRYSTAIAAHFSYNTCVTRWSLFLRLINWDLWRAIYFYFSTKEEDGKQWPISSSRRYNHKKVPLLSRWNVFKIFLFFFFCSFVGIKVVAVNWSFRLLAKAESSFYYGIAIAFLTETAAQYSPCYYRPFEPLQC